MKLKTIILIIKYGQQLINDEMNFGEKPNWLENLYDEVQKSASEVCTEFVTCMSDFLSDKRLHILNSRLVQIEAQSKDQQYMRNNSLAKLFMQLELKRYPQLKFDTKNKIFVLPPAIRRHYKGQIINLLKNIFASNWQANPEEKIKLCITNDLSFNLLGRGALGSHTDTAKQALAMEIANIVYAHIDEFDMSVEPTLDEAPAKNAEIFKVKLSELRTEMSVLQKFDAKLHKEFSEDFLEKVKKAINVGVTDTQSGWRNLVATITSHDYQGAEKFKPFRQILQRFPEFFQQWNNSFVELNCPYYAQLKAYQVLCDASIKFLDEFIAAIDEDSYIEKPMREAAQTTHALFVAKKSTIEVLLKSVGVLIETRVNSEVREIAAGSDAILENILSVVKNITSIAEVSNTPAIPIEPVASHNVFLMQLENALAGKKEAVEETGEVKVNQGQASATMHAFLPESPRTKKLPLKSEKRRAVTMSPQQLGSLADAFVHEGATARANSDGRKLRPSTLTMFVPPSSTDNKDSSNPLAENTVRPPSLTPGNSSNG